MYYVQRQHPKREYQMTKIQEIARRLSGLLMDLPNHCGELPRSFQVRGWIYFAEEFIVAASCLYSQDHLRIHARLQTTGQAIECAFKAYILAAGADVPNVHDLVELCDRAEQLGFRVTELQALAVFQLSLHFFRDLSTGTKFKSRYPTKNAESSRAPIPDHHALLPLVKALQEQALQLLNDAV
jgi:HEPN domain-containing protein